MKTTTASPWRWPASRRRDRDTQKENSLLVAGQKQPEQENGQFLHRGIAARAFKQTFNLADYVKVTNAGLENGLLTVDLVREVPEEMKPRRIEIGRCRPENHRALQGSLTVDQR